MWLQLPNGGTATVEQILGLAEINKWKRTGPWEFQAGIQVGKLTIWVTISGYFEKKYNKA